MNEAELLFTEILNCDRVSLYLNKDIHLDKNNSSYASLVLKRRIKGEPIQYVLGKTEFMGLEFKVNPDVFIPRPETEILIEKTLELVTSHTLAGTSQSPVTSLKILDLGTGSGCIAVSLAKFLKYTEVTATDISVDALKVAKENALFNNVEINFLQSDLFAAYSLAPKTYDLIVSNPPYIPTLAIEGLEPEIQHEPRISLDGGKDGLDFYRRIVAGAPNYLNKCGFLIMEMGFRQTEDIKKIFQKSQYFEIIEVIKDYNNIERVIVANYG